jgi:hypothetical protein
LPRQQLKTGKSRMDLARLKAHPEHPTTNIELPTSNGRNGAAFRWMLDVRSRPPQRQRTAALQDAGAPSLNHWMFNVGRWMFAPSTFNFQFSTCNREKR